ncbi:MAG: AAA family ATPase [Actinomycetota bacterium]|nr:AAA family ATPase [Actinomycetota bacterium]
MAQVFTEFIGRSAPQARIRSAFRDSLTGRARLVLVSGEAGIGKTALLTEATREAAERDALTVWGTCWDAERAPGYWPWAQVLREMVDRADAELVDAISDEDRRALARLVPALQSGGSEATTEGLDSDRARFGFFDAVARWLERSARGRPVVVTLDDLQWADASSLELLEFVVRAHRPVPLLLLGAYRHDELRPEIGEILATISLRADNIRLQGLSATEVRELLAHTGGDDVAERWGDDVHGRTGGHPFLVREVSHALTSDQTSDVVPAAAHDLIARRVARLHPDCRRVLDAAAVAGNEVLPDVLADVLNLPASAVVSHVVDAVRAGVLTTSGDGGAGMKFAHDLYRETVYADLPTPERLALHQQVGAALERRAARGGSVFAGEVARHFAAAAVVDGPDRAIRWALEAAAADRTRLAFVEAAAHLARVRSALDDAGVAVAADALVDLLVAQADAASRAGDPARPRELLHEAHRHAVRLGDPERLAAVALGLQSLGARYAMPRDEVVAVLEEARSAVEGRASAVEAEITASLARELHHSVPKDRARARPLSERAVEIARALDDPATLAACLLARHDILWTPGAAAERVDVAREIVALADRGRDDERRSQGHLLTANALLESGSPAFRAELDEFLRLEEGFRQPRHEYLALTRRAGVSLLEGSLDEGERLIHEAAALGERIGEPDTGNVRMSQLLELARARGEPDQLEATAKMAIGWWIGIPSHAHAVAAGLLADAGDLGGARRALDTVLELGTWREDRSYVWSVFVGSLTVAAARLGNLDLSRQLLQDLAPLAETCGVNGAIVCFVGSHAHWAGVAAKTLGRTEQARDLLLRALMVHQRLGARAWEAETCAELATLDADGAPYGDRAAELAAELGLVGLAARLPRRESGGSRSTPAAWYRDGDVWKVAYGGRSALIRDAKGLHDLAALLARPGEDVPALDLAGSGIRGSESASPVLDAQARAEFRRRINDLEDDLAEAQADDDRGRIERLETERDTLLAELRRATGLGKDRGLGPRTVERARKAVTARIRDAIRRIEGALPELGSHLDRSIVTGNYCRYEPAEPMTWNLHGPEDHPNPLGTTSR